MILEVKNLSLTYLDNQAIVYKAGTRNDLRDHPQATHIFSDISFTLARGQQVALVGKSGNGKSSLLYLLAGFEKVAPDCIYWQGKDLASFSEKERNSLHNQLLGFVFQFHNLLPDFTALENVLLPALIKGEKKAVALTKAQELLEYMNLGHRLDHYPAQLSGGERQRVAIARALINNPQVILADEPTGNLDYENSQEVLALVRRIREDFGTSMLLVTHDRDIASSFPETWTLDRGKIYASTSEE